MLRGSFNKYGKKVAKRLPHVVVKWISDCDLHREQRDGVEKRLPIGDRFRRAKEAKKENVLRVLEKQSVPPLFAVVTYCLL